MLWRPVLTRQLDTTDSAGTQRMVLRRFDSAGREILASYPQRSIASVLDPPPPGIRTVYDALGRPRDITAASELGDLTTAIRYPNFVRTITDARGLVTTTAFQAFDEPDESAPVSISQPLATLTTITRDRFGKPLTLTRSGSFDGSPLSATRRYVYDAQQRLCKVIEPESGATVLEYNSANLIAWKASGQNLASTTDCQRGSVPAAQKISHGYDARQRLTITAFGDGSPAITRDYTADGLLEVLSTDSSSWTTQYNRRRLMTRETLQLDGSSYSLNQAYDSNASLRERGYPDGSVVAYAPNALGEATRVGSYATQITRHPDGALAGLRYGNGISHTTTQNIRGLPARSSDAGVRDDAYAYDANANVTAITDHALNSFTRTLGYDDRDRLNSASNTGIWGGSFGFQYDPLDNLRRSSGPGQDWTWHYNATTWRLERIASSGPNIAVYGYDPRGNATSRNAQTFGIDLAGRVNTVGPSVASYRYDGHGRRMLITKGATRTVQIYSQAGQLVYETPADSVADRIFADGFEQGGNGSKRYIYFNNHLIAEDGSAGLRYLHTDALGSPVAKTNASGTITERTYHFPYGRTVSPPQSGPGFTGHVTDTETGLSYMQARYYDPWAGRFLATDPVAADAGSFNRYWYANNSPYKNIDPDGRLPLGPTWFGAQPDSPETRDAARIAAPWVAELVPGAAAAGCASGGCGIGGWLLAGLDVMPGAGKVVGFATRLGGKVIGASIDVAAKGGGQTTILGENMMQRVVPFAEKTNAQTLPFGTTAGEWAKMTPSQRWKLNDGALRARINEGDSFRYIGRDPFRNPLQRQQFDLTGSELLRLNERGIPYEVVSPHEVMSVIGRP